MIVIPTSTTDLANIPCPAGAVQVFEWENEDQPVGAKVDHVYEMTRRWFVGPERFVRRTDAHDDIRIFVWGAQYADGRVTHEICVDQLHPDYALTPELNRQFIAVLTAVADEIDAYT